MNGIYQANLDTITETELRICGAPAGQTLTTLTTKLTDYKYSHSTGEIEMHFYENDLR